MIVFVDIEDLEIEVPGQLEQVAADDATGVFQYGIAAHLVKTPGNHARTDMAHDRVGRRFTPGHVLAQRSIGGKIIRHHAAVPSARRQFNGLETGRACRWNSETTVSMVSASSGRLSVR